MIMMARIMICLNHIKDEDDDDDDGDRNDDLSWGA